MGVGVVGTVGTDGTVVPAALPAIPGALPAVPGAMKIKTLSIRVVRKSPTPMKMFGKKLMAGSKLLAIIDARY